jgi:hypothetical protein
MGDGLVTGVLRKTRAGGNWLIGGIVVVRCDVVSRYYAFVVRLYGFRFLKCLSIRSVGTLRWWGDGVIMMR